MNRIVSFAIIITSLVLISCNDKKNLDFQNNQNNQNSQNDQNVQNNQNVQYVDLGLPSGTLWVSYNIGATKPEEFGDYFAWGETSPKKSYIVSTYKWRDSECNMTKYNYKLGLTTLLPEDDAATAVWGSEWRMPTIEEQLELFDNCEYSRTEINGVIVAKFSAKNGNSIVFPAAGIRIGKDITNVGYNGFYWSSSLYEKDERYVHNMDLNEFGAGHKHDYRACGFPVRAVRAKKAERNMYSVKFYTSDSTLIESQNVVEGTSARIFKAPAKDGYEFVGWSATIDSVISNMSVYAVYKEVVVTDNSSSAHAYVDLALPSGTLWATYNIGATKPEENGDYFAWGETTPKEVYDWRSYDWSSYKWQNEEMTKYNSKDGLTTLLAVDDVARAKWGSDWRMPTTEEQKELIDNCQYEWTEVNGVSGAKFTASNGNYIFLPAAGHREGSDVLYVGYHGNYWSSSFFEKNEDDAYYLDFNEDGADLSFSLRYYAFSVRPVRAKK